MSETMNPNVCLKDIPNFYMPMECMTQAIAKIIGLVIIGMSCLNKAPIILNLYKSQSAIGLARFSLYGDWLVYTNSALYGILRHNPITAFGEFVALVIQSTILISFTWYLSPTTTTTVTTNKKNQTKSSTTATEATPIPIVERIIMFTVAISYIYYVTTKMDISLYYLLQSTNLPILLLSRGTQILQTYQVKHTGALSIVTTSMSLGGSITRVFTTLKEVGLDIPMLAPFILSVTLNSICCFQYYYFYTNTQQFLKQIKQQQQKKKVQ